jgi:hypothetical protein
VIQAAIDMYNFANVTAVRAHHEKRPGFVGGRDGRAAPAEQQKKDAWDHWPDKGETHERSSCGDHFELSAGAARLSCVRVSHLKSQLGGLASSEFRRYLGEEPGG